MTKIKSPITIGTPTGSRDVSQKSLIKGLMNMIGKGAGSLICTTYAELKQLRDEGKLVPGQQYRITDYECTTVQENTRSAGHQFDIIVTADDKKTLNENARAYKKEIEGGIITKKVILAYVGLEDAEWYSDLLVRVPELDDERGFCYCPTSNVPISFKTKPLADTLNLGAEITYSTYIYSQLYSPTEYLNVNSIVTNHGEGKYKVLDCKDVNVIVGEYKDYFADCNLAAWELKYSLDNDTERFAWADVNNGKGVIYWMKDEWNNECPYDFKNIQYNKGDWVYTFGGVADKSLSGNCHHNIIPYNISLPHNTFGEGCYNNTFGNGCYNNTFGNNCYSNTFVSSCNSNTFGNLCNSNTFGSNCSSNTFGNTCFYNTFGSNCSYNTFKDSCSYNTLGNNCSENTFRSSCSSHTLGNYCSENTFGDSCSSNTLGNFCRSNTFGSNCPYNTLGNGCRSNTLQKSYMRYIALENGVQYVNVTCTDTTSSSKYAQNVHINSGVSGTSSSSRKTCTIATTGNTFLTTFGSANDVTINV